MKTEKKLIFIFLFHFLSKVNGYCGPSSTDDSFNQLKTDSRTTMETTTMESTTWKTNSCSSFNLSTKNLGEFDFFSSRNFTIQISELKSIEVYSAKAVHAIQFNFLNGQASIYGTIQSISVKTEINLENQEIIGINLRSNEWINNIQFLLHDISIGSIHWTDALGGLNGFPFTLTPANISSIHARNFKIITIFGSVNSEYLKELRFQYFYQNCDEIVPKPMIPSTPPPSEPKTTTLFNPTLPQTRTKSLEYGSCQSLNYKTNLLGEIGSGYFLQEFSVELEDLKSIEVYSGDLVRYLTFNYKNGNTLSYGDNQKQNIKIKTLINIENKQILALNVASGKSVDSIQFLLFDTLNQNYIWTDVLGGSSGLMKNIDASNVAPFSSSFKITSLRGYAHPSDGINGLVVGYSYEECNPLNPGPTIPPPPSRSMKTSISATTQEIDLPSLEVEQLFS
jgi:hypothetical protein